MKKLSFIYAILLILSCSSSSNPENTSPTSASLIFPDNNQECNQGVDVIGTTQSTVTFRWNATINTDAYDVVLKNLDTQSTSTHLSLSNTLPITIEKGTPYSWFVISKNTETQENAQSSIWKFYNAGDPVESYAPFPADLISPSLGSILNGGTSQALSWQGGDIDNDIVNYDIFFDTITPPIALEVNTASTSINVTISAGNTYYWRVVTKDSQGNNSESEIFKFRVE